MSRGALHTISAFKRKRPPRQLVEGAVIQREPYILLRVPVIVVSELNTRGSWRPRNTRKKHQQLVVGQWLKQIVRPQKVERVCLVRLGAQKLDGDNLQGAFKGVRDKIAKWLGIDDGDEAVRWFYAQQIGERDGIEIILNPRVRRPM